MGFTNTFAFVGNIQIPRDKEKFYSEFLNPKGTWQSARINFLVKESDTNGMFVELFGGFQADGKGNVYSMDIENNKIEFPWSDRNDEETIKMIANYKKFRFNLGEQVEFITEYDAIRYLAEKLPTITDRIVVTGVVKKEPYKNKFNTRFVIQNVRLAKEDEKNKLSSTMDIFYSKESLDDGVFKEDKLLYLNGYLSQYIKDEGIKYVPHQFVLNAKKVDFENDKHKARFNMLKKYLTVTGKNFVHIPWNINIYRGAEEVEFDESMLTKAQKEQIEFGLATIDDFKPRGNILGDNVFEYKLAKPVLKGNFVDGVIDTELKITEFEEQIYTPVAKTEKFQESEKPNEQSDNEDDDLFN